ncbi:hypothetical protein DKT77_02765 [Meridianimarinicoccus roseus]|uniref:Lipid/polyisoprenoid-binding YceI-like domain-containing protein n=1 Tax=Meridianimarinicoccus roseus TaxID=2072018 RepID=A0A2V2LM83_9RHOB|nr:YceI family protein [Meridianimarinicoccus roseus]PWR04167.1 hypothetical protein DKT77_02765 [Meridianimarinicoccus roseus]
MKQILLLAAATGLAAGAADAEPLPYTIDPSHSELVASWSHLGFSTTRGVIFDIRGDLMFDEENPANSSVSIQIPTSAIIVTPEFTQHLLESGDFFQNSAESMITFTSTAIEVTGENTADITGDLTLNGVTNEVTLSTTMLKNAPGPQGKPIAGFEATTTLDRTNFALGAFTPFIPAEVEVVISLEASPSAD